MPRTRSTYRETMAGALKSDIDRKELDTRRNFGAHILHHLRRYAGSQWINGTSHQALTYGAVADQVEAVRSALWRLGYKAGDKILLLNSNRMQLLPMFLGAACANVAAIFECPGFGVDYLVDAMKTLDLVAICCEPDRIEEALQVKSRLPTIKHVIPLGEPQRLPDCAPGTVITWGELVSKGREAGAAVAPPAEYLEDQICYITATSGTTGKPKLVVHCHESLLATVQANSHPRHLGLGEEDVLLCTSMLCHVYALFDCVCKAIVQGASAAFLEEGDIDALLRAVQEHRVTTLSTVPYTARCLLEHERRKEFDLRSLRYMTTAGTSIAEDVARGLFEELKLKTYAQLYGQTELIFISAGFYGEPSNFKSMGRLAMGVEAMVRDADTGKPLGPHEPGELVLRSPGIMRGYWGRLDEPVTDDQGWYRTGDLCYYDEEGWLYLVQRLSEMFYCRNTKVAPAEVEAALLKCPEVEDCVVVGLPNPETGHLAHAAVVAKPGAESLGDEYFLRFVEANVPRDYRLEGGLTFVDEIPRNKLGKFMRPYLLRWVLEQRERGLK